MERKWRDQAHQNSKMIYLNVDLLGLSGHCHPAMRNITNTRDIPKLRYHLKFLAGDFLTYSRLANDRQQGNPGCRLCPAVHEDIEHVLTTCRGTSGIRERLLPDLMNTVFKISPNCKLLDQSTLTLRLLTYLTVDPQIWLKTITLVITTLTYQIFLESAGTGAMQ